MIITSVSVTAKHYPVIIEYIVTLVIGSSLVITICVHCTITHCIIIELGLIQWNLFIVD